MNTVGFKNSVFYLHLSALSSLTTNSLEFPMPPSALYRALGLVARDIAKAIMPNNIVERQTLAGVCMLCSLI